MAANGPCPRPSSTSAARRFSPDTAVQHEQRRRTPDERRQQHQAEGQPVLQHRQTGRAEQRRGRARHREYRVPLVRSTRPFHPAWLFCVVRAVFRPGVRSVCPEFRELTIDGRVPLKTCNYMKSLNATAAGCMFLVGRRVAVVIIVETRTLVIRAKERSPGAKINRTVVRS